MNEPSSPQSTGMPAWSVEAPGPLRTMPRRACATLVHALHPSSYWRAIAPAAMPSMPSMRGMIALVLASAVTLHVVAAAARISAAIARPVPAATMGPLHLAAEIGFAALAPASRFSGAELWNASRVAGRTEPRGRDAIVAFVEGAVTLAFMPWRDSIAIDAHPANDWGAQRVELTVSLPPLASPRGWALTLLGGPAGAVVVLVLHRLLRRGRVARSAAIRVTVGSAPVAVALGACAFPLGAFSVHDTVSSVDFGVTTALVLAYASSVRPIVLVLWMRGVARALRVDPG